jgi:hypothetical protein
MSALALVTGITPAHADLIFTGSGASTDGTSISAQADFGFNPVTNRLTLIVTNTAAAFGGVGSGASQADVLTQLLFNGTPAVSLPSANGTAGTGPGKIVSGPAAPPPTSSGAQQLRARRQFVRLPRLPWRLA